MSPDQIVAEALATLLDLESDSFGGGTLLDELEGWDSVNALRVLVYLEREVGGSLDFERYGSAVTLGEVADVVATALGKAVTR